MTGREETSTGTVVRFLVLIMIVYCVIDFASGTTNAAFEVSDVQALDYLSQYGYLPAVDPKTESIMTKEAMSAAISKFQSFAGINVTGHIDLETTRMMTMPRCGVMDIFEPDINGRSKRYAKHWFSWPKKNLTYKIKSYPKKLLKQRVDKEIAKAFALWSEYTDLTFTPKSGWVDIEIEFKSWHHCKGKSFDGPDGILAHAFFPLHGGDVHFDKSESWTINSYRGTNLFQVAAHEFGHSLGLKHSEIKSALMAPFYRGYDPDFILHEDDILGIQELYGTKTKHERELGVPDICKERHIDTIFNTVDGDIYVFKGKYYWKLMTDKSSSDYPKLIDDKWKGLPSDIDAAFTYTNGKTYFFKGSEYWKYIGTQMDGDYPKEINEGFPGIPNNIDAATMWTGNGNIYFYKGNKFWRFNPSQKPPVRRTYPKSISNWEGLPNNLEAAVVYNENTYFFKNGRYYRFDDEPFSVDHEDPVYGFWYNCDLVIEWSEDNDYSHSENESLL